MQEKLLSFLAWIILWVVLCFWYNYFFNQKTDIKINSFTRPQNIEMTDERLTQMAERMWISKEELQKEIDSGKDIRTIMQESEVNMWVWMRGEWSFNRWWNQE